MALEIFERIRTLSLSEQYSLPNFKFAGPLCLVAGTLPKQTSHVARCPSTTTTTTMSSASRAPYQRLATRSPSPPSSPPVPSSANDEEIDLDELTRNDPRFNPPTPPWWQRALLIIFVIFLHWVAWKLIPVGDKPVEYPDDS